MSFRKPPVPPERPSRGQGRDPGRPAQQGAAPASPCPVSPPGFKGTELPDFSSTWAGRTRCCLNPLPPLNCNYKMPDSPPPSPRPSHWELQAGDQPDLPLPHAPGQATPRPRALG